MRWMKVIRLPYNLRRYKRTRSWARMPHWLSLIKIIIITLSLNGFSWSQWLYQLRRLHIKLNHNKWNQMLSSKMKVRLIDSSNQWKKKGSYWHGKFRCAFNHVIIPVTTRISTLRWNHNNGILGKRTAFRRDMILGDNNSPRLVLAYFE